MPIPFSTLLSVFLQFSVEAWALTLLVYVITWRVMGRRNGKKLQLARRWHLAGYTAITLGAGAARVATGLILGHGTEEALWSNRGIGLIGPVGVPLVIAVGVCKFLRTKAMSGVAIETKKEATETPAATLAAGGGAGLPAAGMNWKIGLLRLWLVINLPLIAYFSYATYSNYKCEGLRQEDVRYWYQRLREPSTYKGDVRREALDIAVAGRDECRNGKEFAVNVLEMIPAGSAALILAGVWVTEGFKRRRDLS